jgi:PKD repeat protein
MSIPTVSLFPETFDDDTNLCLVHDSLRVRLLEDYAPGDTSILIDGDNSLFPSSGYITLTEQCSDPSLRAQTFWYESLTSTSFDGLILLPEFTDTAKPKFQTNVTMNVTAAQHNAIKDALIAIQEFVGIKGTTDVRPFGATMEGRLNFLRNLVLRPRAWFSVNQRIGIVPLLVTFTDLSFRDPTNYVWDFGDGSSSNISVISNDVISTTATQISHIYYQPGIFDVSLTVSNEFGSDVIVLPNLINARLRAPDPALISVTAGAFQEIIDINPDDEFLYTHLVPGIMKTRINTSFALSVLNNGEQTGDEIISYTWKLGDNLDHTESSTTNASYSIGGIYDIKLRVDTEFGAYRITTLENSVEVVEDTNLFLCIFDPVVTGSDVTQNVSAYEFGQISETFKLTNRSSLPVTRNYNFLSPLEINYSQQKREFLRNNGFTNRTNILSGDNGTAIVYWAEGGASGSLLSNQTTRVVEYEGFTDIWRTPASFTFNRPWNWVALNSPNGVYFYFGLDDGGTSSTNAVRTEIEFVTLGQIDTTLSLSNFKNGAEELLTQVGSGTGGQFSVYRRTWNGNNGYIIRNDGVNVFFRLKSFYRTEGILSDPLLYIKKLTDMPGSTKVEGEMVSLTQGVYFFNNSGEIAVYSPTSSTWAVGGPGINSPSFRSLQDSTVSGFDSTANTLIAASDNDRRAYLSYDYSPNAFLRFNEADLTFQSLTPRPLGEQFVCGVF